MIESILVKKRRITKCNLVVLLFGLMMAGIIGVNYVSAVTYQTGVGVSFTFNPKLTLTLSSSNLVISNLAPGTSDNSNEIAITVSTNAAYGYNLSATVGNSTTYNNTDLTHTSGASSGKFTSIAFESNPANYISSISSNNTWGYSIDSGTKYNGLPLYSDTTNIATLKSTDTTPATGTDTINFLIGAKASTTQPTGDYKNVINFIAVTNHVPINLLMAYESAGKTKQNGYYKMQDMNSSICNMVEVEDDELQVIDTRDNKVYWIAKLRDGHCWMTQNLDLDLGVATLTHNSTTLYHDDTDLGWGSDTTTQSWTPSYATIHLNEDGKTFSSIGDSSGDNYEAKSLDVGNWYYAGYNGSSLLTGNVVNYLTSDNRTNNNGIIYIQNGSGVDYFSDHPFFGVGTSNNGVHGHVGNYYSWSAAIASNYYVSHSYTSQTYSNSDNNPQNSICSAGWRLPIITGADPIYSSEGSKNEYARLAYLYDGYSGSSNLTSTGLETSPLYFVRSGFIQMSSLSQSGEVGSYWSSTVSNSSYAYTLSFQAAGGTTSNDYVGVARYNTDRNTGHSVRCVAR